jgi:signal peptidase I
MKPTIEPGDKLIANKIAYDLRIPFSKYSLFRYDNPKRGEVIVFECPYDPSINFVKRVIGLPGDLIEVENGFIRINGKSLTLSIQEEEKLSEILINGGFYKETLENKTYTIRRVPNFSSQKRISVSVPEDQYFTMGDNRDESIDSREWGFAPRRNILGRASFVYFSLDWASWTSLPKIIWERIGIKF